MKKSLAILLLTGTLFASCNTKSTSKSDENAVAQQTEVVKRSDVVPFTEAKRYFANNTYKEAEVKKITNQEEFDSIFSPSPVMGKDGEPTTIDFSNNYVLAIIEAESNKTPEIIVNTLKQEDNVILLDYSLVNKEETTFTIKPTMILIIDNKYQGELKSIKTEK